MTDNELLTMIYKDMQELKTDVQELKTDVQEVKRRVTKIETDVQEVKRRVTKIETTIENETNKNIKLVAENHIDLARKLNENLTNSSETKERLDLVELRLNSHDADILQLKMAK